MNELRADPQESELSVALRVLDGLRRRGALRLLDAAMGNGSFALTPVTVTLPADEGYLRYVKMLEARHHGPKPDPAGVAPDGGSDAS